MGLWRGADLENEDVYACLSSCETFVQTQVGGFVLAETRKQNK